MLEQLDGDMCGTYLSETLQLSKVLLLLTCVLTLVKGEVYDTCEEGDVSGRHLLSCEDDAGIDLRLHQFLVLVHVHLGTSHTIPQVFEPLHLSVVDGVLVLIDVYQGVIDTAHIVGKCRKGRTVDG